MKYELMAILDPKLTEKQLEKTIAEVEALFKEHKFEQADKAVWGKRDLAYKIKGHLTGYYIIWNVTGEGKNTQGFKADIRIQNGVLRTLFISVPDDYVLTDYPAELPQEDEDTEAKASERATELSKKVTAANTKKAKMEEKEEESEENKEKLEKQLKSILDDDADLGV